MFVRGQNTGSGSAEPYVVLIRIQSSVEQVFFNTELAKKYKYFKALTVQDYKDIYGNTTEAEYITTTSLKYRASHSGSWVNFSTTPVAMSTLTLVDNDAMFVANVTSVSNYGGFAVMLYND